MDVFVLKEVSEALLRTQHELKVGEAEAPEEGVGNQAFWLERQQVQARRAQFIRAIMIWCGESSEQVEANWLEVSLDLSLDNCLDLVMQATKSLKNFNQENAQ